MAPLLSYLLLALITGSLVYCVLAMLGAARYKRDSGIALPRSSVPVSVLRPLAGAEDNTEANLRSLFEQQYSSYEILLSVHEETDPAVAIVRQVISEYPHIPCKLVIAGVSPVPNAKVWCLRKLMPEARHECVVLSDSDVRLPPNGLATITAELALDGVGLVTCPYRAVGGPNLWSRLEALGLNTEFLSGMLTARMLNGMDFAIGCTLATRKAELVRIGGLEVLQRYLAEDFVLGNLLHRAGRKVVLSRSVIEHHIGNDGFMKNWKHRLRWARSTRRSRGWAYVGELFTKTTALGIMLLCVSPRAWGIVLIALAFRAGAAWSTGVWILNDPALEKHWYMLPVQDLASFAAWGLAFFGKTITWRGRQLTVGSDGSFSGSTSETTS